MVKWSIKKINNAIIKVKRGNIPPLFLVADNIKQFTTCCINFIK